MNWTNGPVKAHLYKYWSSLVCLELHTKTRWTPWVSASPCALGHYTSARLESECDFYQNRDSPFLQFLMGNTKIYAWPAMSMMEHPKWQPGTVTEAVLSPSKHIPPSSEARLQTWLSGRARSIYVGENFNRVLYWRAWPSPTMLRHPEPGACWLSQELPVEQLPDHSPPEVGHVSLQTQRGQWRVRKRSVVS